MEIREPTAMVTDYALAVMAVWLGWRLMERGTRLSAPRLWGLSFFALALAAVAGGTSHGFAAHLGELGNLLAWRLTVYSIGVASLCFLAAAAQAYLRRRTRRVLVGLALAEFAVYAVWIANHDDFLYVIYDYAPAMAVVLALALRSWRSGGDPSGPWVVGGILVSFAAAGIQTTGFRWHQYFNHNDLYHLVQMAGLYLLFRGGMLLGAGDQPAAGSSV